MLSNTLMGWKNAREVITWAAPAVGIPLLRYLNDRREQRRELFFRDASTYALGAGIYFAVVILARKAFRALNLFAGEERRNLAAFLLAIGANILYAGIGAVKFSHWISRNDPSVRWPLRPVPVSPARPILSLQGVAFAAKTGGFAGIHAFSGPGRPPVQRPGGPPPWIS